MLNKFTAAEVASLFMLTQNDNDDMQSHTHFQLATQFDFRSSAVLFVLSLLISLFPMTSNGQDRTADEAEIRRLERAWFDAFENNDDTYFNESLDETFYTTDHDGAHGTKAELMAARAKGNVPPLKVTSNDFKIRFYGDVALVTGQSHYDIGPVRVATVRHSHAWVKRPEGWRPIHWQGTPEGVFGNRVLIAGTVLATLVTVLLLVWIYRLLRRRMGQPRLPEVEV